MNFVHEVFNQQGIDLGRVGLAVVDSPSRPFLLEAVDVWKWIGGCVVHIIEEIIVDVHLCQLLDIVLIAFELVIGHGVVSFCRIIVRPRHYAIAGENGPVVFDRQSQCFASVVAGAVNGFYFDDVA